VLVRGFGDVGLLALLIDRVVARAVFLLLPGEARHELIDAQVQLGALLGGAGDDERRARLVDQDRVDFVDDREDRPRCTRSSGGTRVVAQVVEADSLLVP
jgi:hypothetical protein